MPYTVQPNEKFRKLNYYDGLLLTSEEYKLEQNYHSMVHQMHNRSFHGCGVAWGLELKKDETANNMILHVSPGACLFLVDNEGVEVAREIVLTDSQRLDLTQIGFSLENSAAGDYYLFCLPDDSVYDHQVDYKGNASIHKIDKMDFLLEAVANPADPNQTSRHDRALLGKITIAAQDVATAPFYISEVDITTHFRKYSGVDVIEAETHRLLFHPDPYSPDSSSQPSPKFEGAVRADDKRILKVNSAGIDFDGYPGGHNEVNLDGNLSITRKDAAGTYGNLSVAGNVTVEGNLTIKGDQTVLETSVMKVEDNIMTLNRPEGSTADSGIATNYSGLEIAPAGFSSPQADAKWPALLWDHDTKLWKINDYDNEYMDVGYGAPWDTLSKKGIADDLHGHNFLTADRRSAPNPGTPFTKDLFVDDAGNVGIGTEEPDLRLHVSGNFKTTGTGEIGQTLTAKGVINAQSSLNIQGTISNTNNSKTGLRITNRKLEIGSQTTNGDATFEVYREISPGVFNNARLQWNEIEERWKINKYGQDTEIMTKLDLPQAIIFEISDPEHQLIPGHAAFLDVDGYYKPARADTELKTGVFIVSWVGNINDNNADEFHLTQVGRVDFKTPPKSLLVDEADGTVRLPNPGEAVSFIPGSYYYVSDTYPGMLTTVEPNRVSNPVFLAESATSGYVLPYRPSSLRDDLFARAIKVDPFAPESSLRIDQSGNIGVGVNAPTAKLDVAGDIKATSLSVSGPLTINAVSVNAVSNDATLTNSSPNALVTENAVKGYVDQALQSPQSASGIPAGYYLAGPTGQPAPAGFESINATTFLFNKSTKKGDIDFSYTDIFVKGICITTDAIYFSGGYDITTYKKRAECYKYDLTLDTLTPIAPMNFGRSYHQLLELNGDLYAIGGHCYKEDNTTTPPVVVTDGWINSVERYDTTTDTWHIVSGWNNNHGSSNQYVAKVLNGNIYLIHDYSLDRQVPCIEKYTPGASPTDQDSWEIASEGWPYWSFTNAVNSGMNVSVHEGSIYFIGGEYDDGSENPAGPAQRANVYRFDTASSQWSQAASMNAARSGQFTTYSAGGLLYVFGGTDPYIDPKLRLEVYDAGTNTWAEIGDPVISKYNISFYYYYYSNASPINLLSHDIIIGDYLFLGQTGNYYLLAFAFFQISTGKTILVPFDIMNGIVFRRNAQSMITLQSQNNQNFSVHEITQHQLDQAVANPRYLEFYQKV